MSIERIIQKVRDNDVVLWAGSGYSMYAGMPSVPTLKGLILEECSEEEKGYLMEISSLHEFTSTFVNMRGGNKNELYKILKQAYKNVPKTTWVHDLLIEIPQISNIVTTNYDKLFEESYGNVIDVVITNEHVPLVTKNNVLYKIHGDIDLPQTMVVTTEDYTNFFSKQDTPIWNKIKTLFAEKTIVFVGYSLADQNIDYLFDKVTSQLGGFQKEAFLIAPNLPPFTITKLTQKNITYINMTGEKFTETLHDEIKKKLLIDIQNNKVDSQVGLRILEKYKLLPEFEASTNGLLLQSIGTNDEKEKMNLNIKFTGINFLEKIYQSPYQEFEVDAESIVSMKSHFKGIEMPGFNNLVNIKVIPRPIVEKKVDLYFKGNDCELLDVKLEVYKGYEDDSLIRLSNEFLIFEISLKKMNFSYQFKEFKRLNEVKVIFMFLNNLISGEKLTIYIKEEQNEIDSPIYFNAQENIAKQEEFRFHLEFINKLSDIQRHFNVYFRNFEYSITEEMMHIFNIVWADLKGESYCLPYLHSKIKIEEDNGFLDTAIEGKKMKFVSEQKLHEVELFNQIIPINKVIELTCEDTIVINLDDVKTQLEEGSEVIDLLLGSEANGIKANLKPIKV